MNKKETIQSIKDLTSLTSIIADLCQKSGLSDVKIISQNIVSATEKSAFKNKSHKFVVTLSELDGKVQHIVELIKENCTKDDEIIVITSHLKISNYFKKWIIEQVETTKIDFWNELTLTEAIDKYLPNYWGHNDLFLKSYEESFITDLLREVELKKVLKLEKKFDELLNVFIEPKIYIYKEDKETERPIKVKISIEHLLREINYIISGDAGTGKSTLLKHVGKLIIDQNREKGEKVFPIFIKQTDIHDAGFTIVNAIKNILNNFGIQDIDKVYKDYHIVLLIDSLDEFEKSNQEKVISELSRLTEKSNLNFIIGTRNYESLIRDRQVCEHKHVDLSNFDQRQVRQYLDNFFKFDLAKSTKLWENLQENNILERIPVTPLTISLVSILFEERQYEVPATLTDVYDNFNIFLLGRLTVKSRLEFLDINVKERILSTYALNVMRSSNRERKSKNEFIIFIKEFFQSKSITVNEEIVPELLNSITEGTGILYLDDKGQVSFTHDHFMEYYASREIFTQHDRKELEKELIKNFTEYNWQNASIFYAGRTKDMPEFLTALIKNINNYSHLNDCLLAVSGLGYVLQALWMTNSTIRKDGVVTALNLLLKADSRVKELASDKFYFFDGIRDIDVAILNLFWFYKHFNSIVIRDPLKLAFEELHEEMESLKRSVFEKDQVSKLFQLFCIASTLNTGKNEDESKLNELFNNDEILKHPLFILLFDIGLDILESSNAVKLKENFNLREKGRRYVDGIKFYLEKPSDELRFTTYEQLIPIKKVELFTEGKTDASIISNAFSILTYSSDPYWNITSMDKVNKAGGGAHDLHKYLSNLGKVIITDSDKTKIIIGIFDNDSKGNQEFNGLSSEIFLSIDHCTKKHKDLNIYAIKLPIPHNENYNSYHQEKQEFRFFSIEHYFPLDYLKAENMVKETSISNVYEIIGNKTTFADKVKTLKKPEEFENFAYLFRAIDKLTNYNINYMD